MATARGFEVSDQDWVPWSPSGEDAPQRLARYVNADVVELTRLRLLVEDQFYERKSDSTALLGRLYDTLRARRIPYEIEPWYSAGEQVIRDAATIASSFGSCLDLSLLFAAMCKQAGLRPFVAILRKPSGESHSLVLVDTCAAVDRGGAKPPVSLVGGKYPRHTYRRLPTAAQLKANGVAVDVVDACRREEGKPGYDFATACANGASSLLSASYSDCLLVDVVGLQADGFPPFPPLPADKRPVITRRLPMRPSFIMYESRQELLQELTRSTGTVVIYGERGAGKSMLALEVAAQAQSGAGWFLDANDSNVLATSLGDHEMAELGISPELTNRELRSGHAKLALARLRQAPGPWVAVLDNVNATPRQLTGRPEPSADKGQLLLITTTEPEWLEERPGVRVVRLSPLKGHEVTEALGTGAPIQALAGLPLLINASSRFRTETRNDWWSGRRDTAANAPDMFWQAVKAELVTGEGHDGRSDATALALAVSMAWLPSTGVGFKAACDAVVSVAAAINGSPPGLHDVQRVAQQLYRLGLVDLRAERITMHRLFGDAIRKDMARHDGAMTSRLVGALVEHLFASIDTVGRQILVNAGRPAPDDSGSTLYALVFSREDVDAMAEILVDRADPRALHALGGLVERQNEEVALRIYASTLGLIGDWDREAGRSLPAGIRLITVNCLRGKARTVLRDVAHTLDQLNEAVSWMLRCRALCADLPEDPGLRSAFQLTASRAEAMYGILLRKQGSKQTTTEDRLRAYRTARSILEESAAVREALARDSVSPDVDRGRFNLAGLAIRLAQTDEEHKRAEHLDRAWQLYTSVLETREKRYRTRYLEEVVSCVHGRAVVRYYQALLLPSSAQEKSELLRSAAEFAHEATVLRQYVDGTVDGSNTAKSVSITTKIALARLDLRSMASGVVRESDRERATGYLLSAPAIPLHGQ